MRVLKQPLTVDVLPTRIARRFEQFVGLKLSHVCVVVALLTAMYVATEGYSSETGYFGQITSTQEIAR